MVFARHGSTTQEYDSDKRAQAASERVQQWCPHIDNPQQRRELQATHATFGAVADRLRKSTDTYGSRAASGPFLVATQPQQLVTFSSADLTQALRRDFLDAGQGSVKKLTPLAGSSGGVRSAFAAARVTPRDMAGAEGTVIFNSAGAHISSHLAAVSLAALDGMNGSCPGVCMNLYLTNAGVEVSAPPHTDEQDVVIVQTQGRKRWRV